MHNCGSRLSLFAYGSLILPEVFQAVTGVSRVGLPVTAPGFARYALKGRSYPGLISAPGGAVQGVLYANLELEEWQRLDAFEDDFYVRQSVSIMHARGETGFAEAYLIRSDRYDVLGTEGWCLDTFTRTALAPFLARISGQR